jgi:hypothetical protein
MGNGWLSTERHSLGISNGPGCPLEVTRRVRGAMSWVNVIEAILDAKSNTGLDRNLVRDRRKRYSYLKGC